MTVKAVVLATPDKDNAQDAAQYSEQVKPLLVAGGVKVLFRGPVSDMIAGSGAPGTILVLEFENTKQASEFFAQDAYQALLPLRDRGFTQMDIYLVG